ncbi:MarR family winged helix-turn-helix transcriptional regulator [Dellaglioa sp. P0083]|uniref:MarR family winged helix-turn-helix transcriptional regulator n=1 Tax=Dellaglioa kimchii TaxID=3344667 RepID=UPI0038D38B24
MQNMNGNSFYDTHEVEKLTTIYNRMIRLRINDTLKEFELSESNFFYVLLVCESPGVSQDELIQNIYRDHSVVTRAISKLIKDGWLEKKMSSADKRRTELYPTAKAINNYQDIFDRITVVNDESISVLSEEEIKQFEHILEKVIKSGIERERLAGRKISELF